jgi:hypothetical protein
MIATFFKVKRVLGDPCIIEYGSMPELSPATCRHQWRLEGRSQKECPEQRGLRLLLRTLLVTF